MNNQSSSQATNANPITEEPPNELKEEGWETRMLPFIDKGGHGFLQLCADRRFHRAIQDLFQKDTGLEPGQYWIHADAGGTPKMEGQTTAPDYCYHKKGVRQMAWAAHGSVCGGFDPDPGDQAIQDALVEAVGRQALNYPEATHRMYFAKIVVRHSDQLAIVVVYSKIYGASD